MLAALTMAASAAAAPPLRTAPVEFRELGQAYSADAVVEAVRQSVVAAQVSGRILELRVDAGQAVRQGQVIARIDEREAEEALAQSRAQVGRAQAELANARSQLERTRKLIEQKFVSQAALDKAQADYDAAAAQVASSQANAAQALAAKSHATIVAPMSGMVAARHADAGDMAQPGKAIVTLYEPKRLRVVASVPQAKLAEIRGASAAVAELPALGRRIAARAVTVVPAADARTHTAPVRLDLPEGVDNVYPGMFARAHFVVGRAKKLLIPTSAVVHRSEVAGTYVVDEKGGVHFRQVRLGESAGEDMTEVLAGVAPGEMVALDPVAALAQTRSVQK